ncbi:unnamed protein product [Caenorhabditis auriculariae]|uniref:Activin types I and II receptor domain-containing protein n=1 Tax=Caenorhabditis auriculariae TaxID=2777116 RepID=A0A8S1HDF0_9PELO|nr:unnamed protein product [Caenorhabditis auriculariae]
MSLGLLIFFSITCNQMVSGMWCLDGNDCDSLETCALCEGAACLRVQRPSTDKGAKTAMTCLPHDSLIHAYTPEGCRTDLVSGEKMCLCSEKDFCNHSPVISFKTLPIFTVLLSLFVVL